MKREELLKKIALQAKQDKKKRKDLRFLDTMGFLVAKGFLKTNYQLTLLPNKRLNIEDAIWAGKNVEPRILEVLPAAVLRLEKHFDFSPEKHKELATVLNQLKKNEIAGDNFEGVPYEKIRAWRDLVLQDRRTKTMKEKKAMKTFRLSQEVVSHLSLMAKKAGCTETAIVEKIILSQT